MVPKTVARFIFPKCVGLFISPGNFQQPGNLKILNMTAASSQSIVNLSAQTINSINICQLRARLLLYVLLPGELLYLVFEAAEAAPVAMTTCRHTC